ncbi:glycosyltransferase family 2 protein [Asaia sp. HN010]|uniref:glycosyltransferase family 2 protein n=1 Tax=Asaia sp. HN010 TaxID=3081233 RepID=UPI00301646E2
MLARMLLAFSFSKGIAMSSSQPGTNAPLEKAADSPRIPSVHLSDPQTLIATPVISIVVPCHNEEANLAALYDRLRAVLDTTSLSWEIVCINDGSRDQTLPMLVDLHRRDPRVRVADLSRNFGKEAAMTAGLDMAMGQAVIPLDADLQDPPEIIPALIDKWREGFEVVNALREARDGEGWIKRGTAHLFYRIMNHLSDVPIPRDTGDFRLLSKPAIDALRRMPERRRFMKGMFVWVGFRTATITYRRAGRYAGKTSWNYWRLWNFAIEGITSFSQVPLRLASYIGLATAILSILYGAFVMFRTLLVGNPVNGYPSIIVAILFLGGVQLIALGVIGEYIGRIYEETKSRPIYILRRSWPAPER